MKMGQAEQGRLDTRRMDKSGTNVDHGMCRAEPTKIGQAEKGRLETKCGNVDGGILE